MSVFRQSAVKRDRCQKCGVVMLRIFINVLILGLIAGAGYLIRYVSESLTVSFSFPSYVLLFSCVNFDKLTTIKHVHVL